jgi:hypothetical protein
MAAPLLGTAVAYAATTPTNVVTNSTPTTLGKVVTFTAKVTGPSGGATPSGTLTWTLTGPVTTCASTTGPTGASNVATYTCVITVSKAGTYSATAAYPGDTNYNSVTSSADNLTVGMATPTNVVTNSTPTTLGKVVTFTAKVTGPSGAATPTGTLTWTLTGPVTTCASTTGPTGASKRGHLHLCDHRVHDRHLQRHSGLRR